MLWRTTALGSFSRSLEPVCWHQLMAFCKVLGPSGSRSEEHTSELQSQSNLVCRLLLEKTKSTMDAIFTFIGLVTGSQCDTSTPPVCCVREEALTSALIMVVRYICLMCVLTSLANLARD